MESKIEIDRGFFSRSCAIDFNCSFELKRYFLSDLTEFCLQRALPPEVYSGKPILNMKGRDFALIPDKNKRQAGRDELLFLEGSFFEQDKSEQGEFSFEISTEFANYPDKRTIEHAVVHRLKGEKPGVSPRSFGSIFPAEITSMRLGIDFFTSRFAVSILGKTPLVTRTLLIDADSQRVRVRILAERIRNPGEFPLASLSSFTALEDCLRSCSKQGVSLEQAYQNALSEHS